LVSFDFGTNEAAQSPTQVPELYNTFCSRFSGWWTPALLPESGVSQGQKASAHAGLVSQARESELFPRRRECAAGARLAKGASGLLEKHGTLPAPYLTRRLLGASAWGQGICAEPTRSYLTRPLLDANSSFCGAYLHVRRQYLTRRHRNQCPATATQGTRHSGHGARDET
jgi:hypothetical protein